MNWIETRHALLASFSTGGGGGDGGGGDGGGGEPTGTGYTVSIGGGGGTGGGTYEEGSTVTITAAEAATGKTFSGWTVSPNSVVLLDSTSSTTTFVMPASNVVLTSNYDDIAEKFVETVGNVYGGGLHEVGSVVELTAMGQNSTTIFVNWEVNQPEGLVLSSETSPTTSFIMPNVYVKVTANYQEVTQAFQVLASGGTVNGGQLGYSVNCEVGSTVTITAVPAAGKRFISWRVVSGGATLASNTSVTTTFTMPANEVTVQAIYVNDSDDLITISGDGAGGNNFYCTIDGNSAYSNGTAWGALQAGSYGITAKATHRISINITATTDKTALYVDGTKYASDGNVYTFDYSGDLIIRVVTSDSFGGGGILTPVETYTNVYIEQ